MEKNSVNWEVFETFIGENIPTCVKLILELCGYKTFLSLKEIKPQDIFVIQKCITTNFARDILQLKCCHAEYYKSEISHQRFKLLPGHEALVIALPKYIEEFQREHMKKIVDLKGKYSFILNELLQTAEANEFQSVHQVTYSESIRYFAVYIFLICGRACYKMLQSNLPIPSIPTIRK